MDSETDMSDGEINQAGLSSLELWRMLPRGDSTLGLRGCLVLLFLGSLLLSVMILGLG